MQIFTLTRQQLKELQSSTSHRSNHRLYALTADPVLLQLNRELRRFCATPANARQLYGATALVCDGGEPILATYKGFLATLALCKMGSFSDGAGIVLWFGDSAAVKGFDQAHHDEQGLVDCHDYPTTAQTLLPIHVASISPYVNELVIRLGTEYSEAFSIISTAGSATSWPRLVRLSVSVDRGHSVSAGGSFYGSSAPMFGRTIWGAPTLVSLETDTVEDQWLGPGKLRDVVRGSPWASLGCLETRSNLLPLDVRTLLGSDLPLTSLACGLRPHDEADQSDWSVGLMDPVANSTLRSLRLMGGDSELPRTGWGAIPEPSPAMNQLFSRGALSLWLLDSLTVAGELPCEPALDWIGRCDYPRLRKLQLAGIAPSPSKVRVAMRNLQQLESFAYGCSLVTARFLEEITGNARHNVSSCTSPPPPGLREVCFTQAHLHVDEMRDFVKSVITHGSRTRQRTPVRSSSMMTISHLLHTGPILLQVQHLDRWEAKNGPLLRAANEELKRYGGRIHTALVSGLDRSRPWAGEGDANGKPLKSLGGQVLWW